MMNWTQLFKGKSGTAQETERRASSRRRTKLRPGKVVTMDHDFLADCAILDRSDAGLRLRTFGRLECDGDTLAVFDEQELVIRSGRIAWRTETEIGLRLQGPADSADDDTIRRLSGPYYAVGD